ncbi:MAG: sugar isomerase domain-containing protein [Nakamurella sp.]
MTLNKNLPQPQNDEDAGLRYIRSVATLIDIVRSKEWDSINRAADAVATAIATEHVVHVFGTGHSHILAEELYYRAGGLVAIKPLLFDGLMIHHNVEQSTALERLPGLAAAILADRTVEAGDVFIIASNSGGNATVVECAQIAADAGATVIAVTSIAHATSPSARETGLPRLHELAAIVIDNHGEPGDASVRIPGLDKRVGPTSTAVGATIVNAIVVQAAQLLTSRGHAPNVYTSLNTSV